MNFLRTLRRAATLLLLVSFEPGSARAGEADRPNILLVIADDWSYGHTSIDGCPWIQTPAFDRIAREGIRFRNYFTNNPKCSPCRASLLTGRNTWQLEEAMCHFGVFRNRWPVYPDVLEKAGYLVGFTGKGWAPGDFASGGFTRNPAGNAYQKRSLTPPTTGISRVDYAGNFEAFLQARKPDQPFCFWLGGTEPHRTYEDGSGRRAGKKPASVTLPGYYPDSNLIRNDYLDYALEVEWLDSHVARVLDLLEKSGQLENTLIVYTSDNGMPFPRAKGQIYDPSFHLPLAIRWGRSIRPGRVVDDFLNVRDLAPTFLAAAGVAIPETVTGRPFLDALQADASAPALVDPARDHIVAGKERHDIGRPNDVGYPIRAIRTADYLYIRNFHPERWPVGNPETGLTNCDDSPTKTLITSKFDAFYRLCFGMRPAEELYRLAEDPDCLTNLAADPSLAATKATLRDRMEADLRADADPRILGHGEIFDTYGYTGDRSHSYDAFLKASH
jgi:arylsulfatase A-like enzyme